MTDGRPQRRRVLGAEKDPFEPAPLKKTKKPKVKTVKTAKAASKHTTAATGDEAGVGVRRWRRFVDASRDGTARERRTRSEDDLSGVLDQGPLRHDRRRARDRARFERMSVLPDEENPVLVYRGVEDGGKVAIFELTGDGRRRGRRHVRADARGLPVPEAARRRDRVHHRHRDGHETDAQYQLDLVKIYKKKTTAKSESLAKASSSKLKSASA